MTGFVPIRKKPTAGVPLVPFRLREVGGEVLLTNPWGDWVFVTHDELAVLTSGKLEEASPLHAKLVERNFLREGLDLDALADRMSQKKRFLDAGPNLHILIRICNL